MKKLYLLLVFFVFIAFSTGTSFAQVKYDLAYPGILPNHPLYKVKVLRDRITAVLINDPIKKTEFYLLQADKGIHAAAMLVDKNEVELAKETALKAENNMTLLTFGLKKLRQRPDQSLFDKLKLASLKHQEVLSSKEKKVGKDDKKTFQQVINFSKTNLSTIEMLEKKIYTR